MVSLAALGRRLVKVVDEVCREIESKEAAVDVLCLSPGLLQMYTKTSEDVHLAVALAHYHRTCIVVNLLPLLQNATSLQRAIFKGGKFEVEFILWIEWRKLLVEDGGDGSNIKEGVGLGEGVG
ncbi:uncharacterized protein K444DRAFT_665899 [Hyaloscypha bicolor E]|uniref:Uncharacterized protein n=1 Tax=Hyaloscypha bicolor E TaxID=1095630 RepID=A0A2J6SZP3_9HELO|nr:uncharacterized protein K444DRAFT_665899 [Hyaloscypha bicolor E]PMD56245.1 hypothetical protein K444DRAFT_665899 [Hyaloscypha bicolor E]